MCRGRPIRPIHACEVKYTTRLGDGRTHGYTRVDALIGHTTEGHHPGTLTHMCGRRIIRQFSMPRERGVGSQIRNPVTRQSISKLRMAMVELLGKSAEWDPIEQQGNPASSRIVRDCLKHATEEQKVGVPVKQAPPLLSHNLQSLVRYMLR